MNKELKKIIDKDLFRYFCGKKLNLKQKIFMPLEIKYMIYFRKIQFSKNIISQTYYRIKLKRIFTKTMIQIPYTTKIGEGFYIGHCGRIIINPLAVIGKNVNIATGVTIGVSNRGKYKGTPTIGNEVWIGTNAVIVGKITMGNDVLIAPNCYVNFDVPDHSIVIGNPGIIHPKENACADYITNKV